MSSEALHVELDTDANWVAIAILGKARGNRGEVTAVSLSSKPERFATLQRVYLVGRDRPFIIEEIWEHNGALIFKFAGVDSISDAELLKGLEVRIPIGERAPLDPGEFYNSDLIGCEVIDSISKQPLGKVAALVDGGGPGLLELEDGALIPFAKDFCVSIDIAKRRIEVKIPSGLLELNVP